MQTIGNQLTSRDAALLTWIAVGLILVASSAIRGGDVGRSVRSLLRQFVEPQILGMVALIVTWLMLVTHLASLLGLWDAGLLKDTIVIVAASSVMTGFKALALTKGEETMRGEVRSLTALVVVMQFVANLRTFPYLVELMWVPVAVLVGGMQAVAHSSDEYKPARPLIDGLVVLLGVCVLSWSVYKLVISLDGTEWGTIGRSFALAFWLPAATLPAVYFAALALQYDSTMRVMKHLGPVPLCARTDFYRHHGLNLRRLNAFAQTRGRMHEYALASSREERLAILRAPTKD